MTPLKRCVFRALVFIFSPISVGLAQSGLSLLGPPREELLDAIHAYGIQLASMRQTPLFRVLQPSALLALGFVVQHLVLQRVQPLIDDNIAAEKIHLEPDSPHSGSEYSAESHDVPIDENVEYPPRSERRADETRPKQTPRSNENEDILPPGSPAAVDADDQPEPPSTQSAPLVSTRTPYASVRVPRQIVESPNTAAGRDDDDDQPGTQPPSPSHVPAEAEPEEPARQGRKRKPPAEVEALSAASSPSTPPKRAKKS